MIRDEDRQRGIRLSDELAELIHRVPDLLEDPEFQESFLRLALSTADQLSPNPSSEAN